MDTYTIHEIKAGEPQYLITVNKNKEVYAVTKFYPRQIDFIAGGFGDSTIGVTGTIDSRVKLIPVPISIKNIDDISGEDIEQILKEFDNE